MERTTMETPIVTVYTNDRNLWLLGGFQYLFKKYWSSSQKVRIVGYSSPKNGILTDNFSFYSIDRRNYPASEWSSGVIRSLNQFIKDGEDLFIMMLEDFWLIEPVNVDVIQRLVEYLRNDPKNILRIDLTADRCQHRSQSTMFDKLGDIELIKTAPSSPYQMSFQAAIWNLKLMREVLTPYEDPWQSEIFGSKRLADAGDKYTVLGTTCRPVRYQPVYRSKRVSLDISRLSSEDQAVIMKRGWI
jgi:hypothetical protein